MTIAQIVANFNFYIVIIGVILFISVYASKISEKIGIPLLLIFLGIGMLLGSEGIGGIEFDNALLTQAIGTMALIFILYSGGLDTFWEEVKPVALQGFVLATIGVLITAFVMACFIYVILDFTFLESLLLGSVVSSTDIDSLLVLFVPADHHCFYPRRTELIDNSVCCSCIVVLDLPVPFHPQAVKWTGQWSVNVDAPRIGSL